MLVGYFDRMRTERNHAIYDIAGLITGEGARVIFEKAVEFVDLVKGKVQSSRRERFA